MYTDTAVVIRHGAHFFAVGDYVKVIERLPDNQILAQSSSGLYQILDEREYEIIED